jgi:WD40 repeat protein
VNAVAFSPDGNYAISGGADRTLRLWDTTTGRCLRTVEAHRDQLTAVAFTADGTQVISGSQDATLKLWDLASGNCVLTFEGHQAGIRTVALSRDRRFALSGGDDRTLKLWDLNSGECLRTLEGHQANIRSVALSADGHYALSGGDDRTLKLWDLNSGECLRTLEGHQANIRSVALSADGRYALSGGDDRLLKLWMLDWELVEKFPTAWDEGAKAYLTVFLALHTPTLGLLPKNRDPNDQEVRMALTHQGTPTWTEADFMSLLQTLGEVGYGWLRPEGVRQELQTLASTLQQAPPAAAPTASPTAFATAFGSTFETAFPTGFVEPEPPVAKVILSVTEGSLQGQRYEFSDRTTCIIGRAKDCNLQLPNDEFHKTVSRYHCLLDINPPAVRIRDLGSLHGTYVNGQIIGRRQPNQSPEQPQASFPAHDLAEGDEIKLGKTIFRVQIEAAPVDAPNDVTSMAASPLTAFDQTVAEPFPATPASVKPGNVSQPQAIPELKDYTVLKPIHHGEKGVYLARHQRTNEVVALKVMPLQPETRLPAIEACLQQIESTKTLQHVHIAQLIEAGSAHNLLYILQEYCDRGSVIDLMQERGGRLSVDEAVAIILQVLDALEYAHSVTLTNLHPTSDAFLRGRGLVHRDLHPSQILLSEIQGTLVAKIADYGLAKAMDQTGLGNFTVDQRRADAPLFMPRQRAVNFKYTEPEVDIWASAACLYYMLTGAYPRDFAGKDPYLAVLQTEPVPIQQRNPNLPKALAEVIDMALIDIPEIRIKDAATFKQVLNNVR